MSSLEQAMNGYVETLRRFTTALRAAERELKLLRASSRDVERQLSTIGGILAYQAPSPASDHALSMLAWAVKTTCSTLEMSARSFDTAKSALPHLDVRVRALGDLSTALKSASTVRAPVAEHPPDR